MLGRPWDYSFRYQTRDLGNAAIPAVATDEQMERFGDKWASMAITEPGSGSDSGSITAKASSDGDEWVLNGEKIFVTCAERADSGGYLGNGG